MPSKQAIAKGEALVSGLAAAGLINPIFGVAAGLAKLAGSLSGGEPHGRGTPGRAKSEQQFIQRQMAKSLEENQAGLTHYLTNNRNCRAASDPASCADLRAIWQRIIQQKGGTPAPPPVFGRPTPAQLAPAVPVIQMAIDQPQQLVQGYYQPDYAPRGAPEIQPSPEDGVTADDAAWLEGFMRDNE